MAELTEIYKCDLCTNMIEVINPGVGELVCCGQPMKLLVANTVDASVEKHVPVLEIQGEQKIIRVGATPHPMEKEHYIMFIEAISADKKYLKRKYLFPGEEPMMEFKAKHNNIIARDFCNLHGLWKS